MKIITDYELDENKFREFIHTIFRENDDEVYIKDKSTGDRIILEHKNLEFNLPVLFDVKKQKMAMFKTFLLKIYNKDLSYGGLVGVRPTKLLHKFLEEGKSFYEISEILEKVYLLSKEKIDLLIEVVKNELDYIDKKTVGIYIGLAFCPTKCTYCSFPAYLKKGKYEKIYDKYFETIIKETKEVAKLLRNLNLKINSIYVGGGTPSFLSYDELEELTSTIHNEFNLEYLEEYTFEAGRIDTIDRKKLEILKKYGVDRISINPQSFKEETLKIVNRYHDIDKLNDVYNLAKELGFVINMDFIIGLPKENTEDILNTIDKIKEYDVENVTIHNLSLKKASYLTKEKYSHQSLDYDRIYSAVFNLTKEKSYIPYYMYRQKNSYSWGENIGFCKNGYQSRYNIDMIEENKNIFAIGAGAYTKLISENEIIRITSPKDPIAYTNEYEVRIEKKKKEISEFYNKL